MGREELTGERNIRDVAAIGMDPLVEDEGGTSEGEAFSRVGG
jgi:hypothetical protein